MKSRVALLHFKWRDRGYPHLNPRKIHNNSFHDKMASEKNEKIRLIVKGNNSTKRCNRVELGRIERLVILLPLSVKK